MVTVLRPLSTSELLDRTFHIYRNHFLLFAGIMAIPQLFVLALQLGNSALIASQFVIVAAIANILILFVNWVAIESSHAATVVAVSDINLEKPSAIGLAYSVAKRSLLRVIGISFLFIFIPGLVAALVGIVVALLVAIPFGLLSHGGGIDNVTLIRVVSGSVAIGVFVLVPLVGLRWWLAWAVAVPVAVVEGSGVRASLRRSKELTKGSKGRIFLICLLILVLTLVVSWVMQFPVIAIAGFRSLRDPGSIGPKLHAIQAACAFLSTALVGPLLTIALTLVYYDQRVRKEGFDLQLMMANLQGTPQTPVAAAAAPTA